MSKLAQVVKGVGSLALALYLVVAVLMLPYYNWQYAKDHGFLAWFFLGEFTASAKTIAWPYFVFLAVYQPRVAVTSSGNQPQPRVLTCKEPLPEFTLGATSNPSDAEVEKLCSCIWSKLPEGGWERRISEQMRRGEDPGWRKHGFGPRFGAAVKACGGMSL